MTVINVMKNGDHRESMEGVTVKVSPEVMALLIKRREKDDEKRDDNNSTVSA